MTHRIRRVGIDLDHTVVDFLSTSIPLMQKLFNLEPDLSVQSKFLKEIFKLTPDNSPPNWKYILFEELHVFRNLPKLEQNIEQLTHELIEDVKVYIITARPAKQVIMEDTIYWLNTNGFKFTDVFFTKDKIGLCKAIDIDVMLDDDQEHIVPLLKSDFKVVIRNQPWNQNLEFEEGAKRADNWKEMLEATKEFLK